MLRNAHLVGSILVKIDLRKANLSGSDLRDADLRDADLSGAYFGSANLAQVKLNGANLSGTYFTYPFFGSVKNLTPQQVKQAKNWEQGIYDPEFRKKLGLP